MRSIPIFSVLLIFATNVLAADRSLDESAVQQAVQKSVAWLQNDMQTWHTEHGCAACHHGPMYLWSVSVAKQKGYAVNEPQLQELTQWLLTDDQARIFPKVSEPTKGAAVDSNASDRMTLEMMGHKNLSQPTIYLTHALNALPERDPLKQIGWHKVIDHLSSAQNEDGSFAGRNAWRPIFNTPQILTRFVFAGVQDAIDSSTAGTISERQLQVLRQAGTFLSNQIPDETLQGIVLRILSERRSSGPVSHGQPSASQATLVIELKKLQRSDGGWSQTDDRETDAFATGQSLTALQRAGVTSTDPAIRSGIGYLLQTQDSKGTWPMTSRPNPETGKPAEFLNPITYAATAWATLGLTSYVPHDRR